MATKRGVQGGLLHQRETGAALILGQGQGEGAEIGQRTHRVGHGRLA